MKKDEIIIYTDGCSLGNPGPGGWAAVLISHSLRKEIMGGFKHTTNNRMEILAIIKALELIKSELKYEITIYTDSKLITDSINKNWIWSWRKKGWKKADKTQVLNVDLWERLYPLLKKFNVKFEWIKGHSGIPENERCDYLSKLAASSDNLENDVFYIEKPSIEFHDMGPLFN